MKKILGLVLAALVVMAGVSAATFAYFSDTETATDNTITAGTLNLKVGATDGTVTAISLADKKPTDAGTAATWALENTGSLAGTLAITVSAITNDENTRLGMETTAGDASAGATDGELGGLLKIAFWHDVNGDGNLDVDETYLKSDATVVAWAGAADTVFNIANVAAAYATVDSYATDAFASVAAMTGATAMGNFKVMYNFPDGGATDNVAQSDDVKFTLTFNLQ